MIKKLKYIFLVLSLFISYPTLAKINIESYGGNIYVEKSTVEELEDLYSRELEKLLILFS